MMSNSVLNTTNLGNMDREDTMLLRHRSAVMSLWLWRMQTHW